jgi:hypothetical protein
MLNERGVGVGLGALVLVGVGDGADAVVLVGVGEAVGIVVLVAVGGWVGGAGVLGPGREHPKANSTVNNIPMETTNSFSHSAFLIIVLMLE